MQHNLIIPQRFIHSANQFNDRTAFIFYENNEWKTITYKELLIKVSAISEMLKNKGINKSDCIAICSENMPQWCAAYLAISSLGVICVPLNAELGPDELQNLINASGVKAVFSSSHTHKKMLPAFRNREDMVINFHSQEFQAVWQNDKLIETGIETSLSPDDIASIIYTSGTTGAPKGVMLTHKNFSSNASSVIKTKLIGKEDNLLSILPLHHTYPFMCTFIVPLFLGAAITYPPGLKGPELINTIRDKKVTILSGVPQLLDMILKSIESKIKERRCLIRLMLGILLKISSMLRKHTGVNAGRAIFGAIHRAFGRQLRFLSSGGAKLKAETMKRLETYGFTVIEGYGLTETSPVVTFNAIDKRKPGSAGKPVEDVEIRIDVYGRDEHGAAPAEGEILIKGPMVMKGYHKMMEETEKAIKDGWLYTGDIGYIDNEGYLFITGRKKEVIVLSSGKNVYPEDVERQYSTIPLIKEICVFGKEEGGAVTLYGLIVPDTEYAREMKIASINESLKWNINEISYKLPGHMRLKGFTLSSETLPRTPLGKLRRFLIKEIIEKKEVPKKPVKKTEYRDSITLKVIESIRDVISKDIDIKLDDNLELDIGLDSLKRIELVVELEKRFRINLPESFGIDIQDVNELIEKIKSFLENPEERLKIPSKGLKDILLKTPSSEELKSVGIEITLTEKAIRTIILSFIRSVFRLIFRAKIKGSENLIDPPFILCSNHSSYLDAFLVSAMLPKSTADKLYFQGAREYFKNPVMSRVARLAHVIPIDPDAFLTKALNLSAFILKNGMVLCTFPEGGRSFDGKIQPFMKGTGILSIECNVPVIPALITGTYEALSRGKIFPRFKMLTLSIGKPVYPSAYEEIKESPEKDKYQLLADAVREKVLELY